MVGDDATTAGFVYFVTSDGAPPLPPPPPGPGQCAANHGSTAPCCGQPGNPVPTAFQCPSAAPTCVGYIYNNHYGHCVAPPGPPKPPPAIYAVLPQLELLVHGTPGTKDVAWANVVFADATWLLPSSEVGFVEMQAGCTCRASPCSSDDSTWVPTTANILMEGVHGATFDRCTFTRLGAVRLPCPPPPPTD